MRTGKQNRFFKLCLLLGASALVSGLSGCAGKQVTEAGGRTVEGFGRPEAMLLVATERNRYEQIYTDQIWNVSMPGEEESFEDFLLAQVRQFAEDLKVVGAMAEEYGIDMSAVKTLDDFTQVLATVAEKSKAAGKDVVGVSGLTNAWSMAAPI